MKEQNTKHQNLEEREVERKLKPTALENDVCSKLTSARDILSSDLTTERCLGLGW